jgi:hypothetical protein
VAAKSAERLDVNTAILNKRTVLRGRKWTKHQRQAERDVVLEVVTMRLLAYDREERYWTAEFAAHDLTRRQDTPRTNRENSRAPR